MSITKIINGVTTKIINEVKDYEHKEPHWLDMLQKQVPEDKLDEAIKAFRNISKFGKPGYTTYCGAAHEVMSSLHPASDRVAWYAELNQFMSPELFEHCRTNDVDVVSTSMHAVVDIRKALKKLPEDSHDRFKGVACKITHWNIFSDIESVAKAYTECGEKLTSFMVKRANKFHSPKSFPSLYDNIIKSGCNDLDERRQDYFISLQHAFTQSDLNILVDYLKRNELHELDSVSDKFSKSKDKSPSDLIAAIEPSLLPSFKQLIKYRYVYMHTALLLDDIDSIKDLPLGLFFQACKHMNDNIPHQVIYALANNLNNGTSREYLEHIIAPDNIMPEGYGGGTYERLACH